MEHFRAAIKLESRVYMYLGMPPTAMRNFTCILCMLARNELRIFYILLYT